MAEFMKHIVALLLLLIASIGIANCARQKSPLLIEDEGNRRNRPAECHFGKELKELGSTWFPDLGAPFGKMYCIKCECVPVQRKRRIVARVQCRNIKNECPKPTCDEPILLPGRCCKTCPGDSFSPDIVQDTPMNMTEIEEDRNVKHFGAVLTGRTSVMLKRDGLTYSTQNPQNIAATGRFSFHKRNLYYSFYISEKAVRPRAIQFIDATGNILEEHSLVIPNNGPNSMYQNATGKICGVWRRVPKDYRRMLREDQINVVLIWGGKTQSELALAGPISKYPALSTELFSALLEPSPGTNQHSMAGSGGTAIVSTSSGATSSIHLTLVLNGLFSSDETADVPLNIRLESVEKRQIIIEDVQRVKKPSYDINVIEVSSPVSVYDLRMLTRGKLQIVVESRKNPEALRIQGNVVTRVSCEIFQTLLSSHNPESKTKSDGYAWLFLNKDGSLVYNIQTHNLNFNENPLITLISENGGGKKNTELEDLTSSLQNDHAYGVVDRLGPRVLEPLYSGNLGINIATTSETSLIRGRFVSRPVTDSRDSPEPVLLKRVGDHVPMHSVGMAWIAVDNDCNLHYDISVTGLTSQLYPLQAYLLDMPMEVYGAPVNRRLLEEFSGNHLEGFLLSISQTDLAKLESSVNFLEIVSKDNHNLLKTKLKPIKVPNLCYPIDPDNDDIFKTPRDNADQASNDSKCFYANRFYDDGEQWHSSIESCTVCACNNRRVKCDTIKCPPLKCKKEDQQHRKGECCPTCPDGKHSDEMNNTLPRGCKLGEQFYKAGSSWHPYLPPNGFDTCAVCTCDALTLEVSCPRTTCPPLNCSEKVAYRQDKKACCKRCPDVKVPRVTAVNTEEMKDQGSRHGGVNSPTVIMATGGCKSPMGYHPNGADWHPVIASHGEQKCIKCKCKDGNINCEKKRCPRSVCQNQKNSSKKQPLEDECCQCRARRPQNGQRRRQKQQEKSQNNLTKS